MIIKQLELSPSLNKTVQYRVLIADMKTLFSQICIAPSLGEVNETKCSLNFGLRAMRITNVARLNVEVNTDTLKLLHSNAHLIQTFESRRGVALYRRFLGGGGRGWRVSSEHMHIQVQM